MPWSLDKAVHTSRLVGMSTQESQKPLSGSFRSIPPDGPLRQPLATDSAVDRLISDIRDVTHPTVKFEWITSPDVPRGHLFGFDPADIHIEPAPPLFPLSSPMARIAALTDGGPEIRRDSEGWSDFMRRTFRPRPLPDAMLQPREPAIPLYGWKPTQEVPTGPEPTTPNEWRATVGELTERIAVLERQMRRAVQLVDLAPAIQRQVDGLAQRENQHAADFDERLRVIEGRLAVSATEAGQR